jgi:serine/threonine protein phosphatase 1
MRTWVIPDVHGCFFTLRTLVEDLIRLRRDDNLIFLGDLIDRGPDSKGVADYVLGLMKSGINTVVLKGNHEEYLVLVYREEQAKLRLRKLLNLKSALYRKWILHGGSSTLQSFGVTDVTEIPESYIEWIESLEFYRKWNNFLVVHAGFNFENEDIFSDTWAMMWEKDYKIDPVKLGNCKIIHGHVPVTLDFINETIKSDSFRFIDLDNGVYLSDQPGYGNLVALELNTMQLLVQPNVEN